MRDEMCSDLDYARRENSRLRILNAGLEARVDELRHICAVEYR